MQKNTLFLIVLILCLGCNCEELTVGTDGTNSTEDPDGTEGKPDLRVSSIDTPVVDCSLGECESFAVVTIQNDGEATANSFTVKTIFDPEGEGMHIYTVDSLEAGKSYEIMAESDALGFCYDPDCEISATVDDGDSVMESNETNNELTTTFSDFKFPDFEFANLPTPNSGCIFEYESCKITGCIRNIGSGNNVPFGSVSVSFYHKDYMAGIHVGLGIIEVDSMRIFVIDIPADIFCTDGCEAIFKIDENNYIPELDTNNNVLDTII